MWNVSNYIKFQYLYSILDKGNIISENVIDLNSVLMDLLFPISRDNHVL